MATGVCMHGGGVHDMGGGCARQKGVRGGGCAWQGVCMCDRGHAWQGVCTQERQPLQRTVRILLEDILVLIMFA